MKKWICTVCGYIHEGPEPPDECPVCGADKSMFEEVEEKEEESASEAAGGSTETGGDAESAAAAEGGASEGGGGVQKWICTVCGYIHEGPEPPDECPVCGADKSAFEPVDEEEPKPAESAAEGSEESGPSEKPAAATAAGETEKEAGGKASEASKAKSKKSRPNPRAYDLGEPPKAGAARLYYLALDQMLKHHAHPVSVHIPNGVIPLTFIFVLLFLVTGWRPLETAAFVNMIFVLLTLPFVLFSGYIEWQKRYRGFMSKRFVQKIAYASTVAFFALVIVIWWLIDRDVLLPGAPGRWVFVLFHAVMLGAAIMAGLIGGKFIFRD